MLKYHPEPGKILMCNFDKLGLQEPEMTKIRPALVVSPRLKRRNNLLAVVALSTTDPIEIMPYHCKLEFDQRLPEPWDSPAMWVKADMIYTVRFERLDLIRAKRKNGHLAYITKEINPEQLKAVRKSILNGLGLPQLTKHL